MLGRTMAGSSIRRKIASMFAYRHRTTADDLAAHRKYHQQGTKHIAVTGSRGLIGRELTSLLTTGGHRVTALLRGEASEGQLSWDPAADRFDASVLAGIDAVVHLAGENIAAARWTESSERSNSQQPRAGDPRPLRSPRQDADASEGVGVCLGNRFLR